MSLDAADKVRQRGDRGIHARGVEGPRSVQPSAGDARVGEPPSQVVDGVCGARDHAQAGGVDRREAECGAEQRAHLGLRQEDREHRAGRHRLHHASAGDDQAHGIFEREHPGDAGSDVLADAVPDHRGRRDAPVEPELRERVLDQEEGGLGEVGLAEPLGRLRLVVLRGEHHLSQVEAELGSEEPGAVVHVRREDRLAFVQVACHADMLSTLAREQERHPRRAIGGGDDGLWAGAAQQRDRLSAIAPHDAAAMVERPAPGGQRVGDGTESGLGVRLEVVREPVRPRDDRGAGLGRQPQQHGLIRGRHVCLGFDLGGRRLLEDDMYVAAADAERADAGPPRSSPARPRPQLVHDGERAGLELQLGVRAGEVQGRGELSVLQHQHRLDQASDPRGGVEVPDVALDRSDRAEADLLRVRSERLREGRDLDGISERGGRAVGLDVPDGLRLDACHCQRLTDDGRLAIHAGRRVPGLHRSVVVDRGAADDRRDGVTARAGVIEASQYDDPYSVARHCSCRFGVEWSAVPVRGGDASRLVHVALEQRGAHGHPAGDRDVALAVEQALAGEMDRGQRG